VLFGFVGLFETEFVTVVEKLIKSVSKIAGATEARGVAIFLRPRRRPSKR
jgi:hypothetical protein